MYETLVEDKNLETIMGGGGVTMRNNTQGGFQSSKDHTLSQISAAATSRTKYPA